MPKQDIIVLQPKVLPEKPRPTPDIALAGAAAMTGATLLQQRIAAMRPPERKQRKPRLPKSQKITLVLTCTIPFDATAKENLLAWLQEELEQHWHVTVAEKLPPQRKKKEKEEPQHGNETSDSSKNSQ